MTEGSSWRRFSAISLVLTVVPEHPWARQGKISIEELPKQPFIHRERGSGTRMAMSRILEDHGFDPSRLMGVAEMGSTEAVRQGIKGRIGASILSREAVAEDLQQGSLIAVEIEGISFLRPLYLIQRKNRQMSPLVTAFLAHVRTAKEQT